MALQHDEPGLGGAVGYDLAKNEYGGIAVMLALDSEGIGAIPLRDHTGMIVRQQDATERTTSLTFALAYNY